MSKKVEDQTIEYNKTQEENKNFKQKMFDDFQTKIKAFQDKMESEYEEKQKVLVENENLKHKIQKAKEFIAEKEKVFEDELVKKGII